MPTLLIPQPAQFRTIFTKSGVQAEIESESIGRRTFLYFPPHIFAVTYSPPSHSNNLYYLRLLQVAFSKDPFKGTLDEKIFGLPLCNLDRGFNVCLYDHPYGESLQELARKSITLFWSSPFVNYRDNYSYWKETYNPKFLTRWKKATEARKLNFFEKANLKSSPSTVNIKKMLQAHEGVWGTDEFVVMDDINEK